MKRLYVLRHAKSSWAQPGLSDIERPLNRRGEDQVSRLNPWFKANCTAPDRILCSPSTRTRQTYAGIKSALGSAELEIVQSLYHGTVDVYLDALWTQTKNSIMIIGHNPTCDELSRYLTNPSSPAAEKLMAHHFGTANLSIFDLEQDEWSELDRAGGSLMHLIRPKDLM
ncbi:MAG: SixA phosphatase family protein [Rhizobiaceae bacterium]